MAAKLYVELRQKIVHQVPLREGEKIPYDLIGKDGRILSEFQTAKIIGGGSSVLSGTDFWERLGYPADPAQRPGVYVVEYYTSYR
jgi:hypothetical protein